MRSNALDLEIAMERKADIHDAAGDTSPDPFGDEENAKVKYRTMTWWYAANPSRLGIKA